MPSRIILNLIRHEVARRILLKQTPEAIAFDMELSPSYIKGVLRNEDFKRILEDLRTKMYLPLDTQIASSAANLRDRINAKAEASLHRLEHLLDNAASEQIQMHAADSILDRAGYTRKHEVDMKIVHFDEHAAGAILDALRKGDDGAKRLEGREPLALAKAPDELDQHPIVQHKRTYGSDESDK